MDKLSIIIKAKLDEVISINEINTQIEKIQNQIQNIKINIDVDKNIINTLNKFNENVNKVNNTIKNGNKVYKEQIEIIKHLDGTTDESKKKIINNNQQEIQSVQKLNQSYKQLGEETKRVTNLDAQKEVTGIKRSFEKNGVVTTLSMDKDEHIKFSTITDNIKKRKETELKAQKEIREALIKTEQTRRKEIEKSEQIQGKFTQKALLDSYKLEEAEKLRVKKLGELKVNNLDDSIFLGNQQRVKSNLESHLKNLYGVNTEITKLEKSYDKTGKELWKYTTNVKTGKDTFDQYKGTIDKTTKSLYEQGKTTEKTLNRNLSMFEQFKIAISRIPIWMLGMTAFYAPLRAFRSGVQAIYEIDTEITNLRKVSDETTESLNRFALSAAKIGAELGKSTQEVIKATTEFSRLGYSLGQSEVLSKEALLYSNVGDMGVEEATQNIISAVKGFGIAVDEEGNNIRKIVDIYNEVGKIICPLY